MHNASLYNGILIPMQANFRLKLKFALSKLRNFSKQVKIQRLAKLASLRRPFKLLSEILELQIPRKSAAFDLLKSNMKNKTSNYISRIMYLLSQKFRKNIDENFLNEQIKYMILKNKIHQKSIVNFVKDSEIEIHAKDYESENKIEKLETLIKFYRAIELFCPLDLYFFKIKQTYNRQVMRSICIFIRLKAQHQRMLKIEAGLNKLDAKLTSRMKHGFSSIKRFKRKHYKNFALIIGLVFKHRVDFNLKASLNALKLYKLRDRKTWIFFVLHNRFHFSKKYYFLLLCLTCLNGDDFGELSRDFDDKRSLISHSYMSRNKISNLRKSNSKRSVLLTEEDQLIHKPKIDNLHEHEVSTDIKEAFRKMQDISKEKGRRLSEESNRRTLIPVENEIELNEKCLATDNLQDSFSSLQKLQNHNLYTATPSHQTLANQLESNREIDVENSKTYNVSPKSKVKLSSSEPQSMTKRLNFQLSTRKSGCFKMNPRTNASILHLQSLFSTIDLLRAFDDLKAFSEAKAILSEKVKQSSLLRIVKVFQTVSSSRNKENLKNSLVKLRSLKPVVNYGSYSKASHAYLKKSLRFLVNIIARREYGLTNRAFHLIKNLSINYEIIEVEDLTNTLEPVSIVINQNRNSTLNQTVLLNGSYNNGNNQANRQIFQNANEISVVHKSSLVPRDVQLERLESVIRPSINKLVQKGGSRIYETHKSFNGGRGRDSRFPSDHLTETKESFILNPSHYNFPNQIEAQNYEQLEFPQYGNNMPANNMKNYKSEKKIPTPMSALRVPQSYKFK
jgi:hypothetical protein